MNSASGCGSNALRSVANLAVSGVSAMRAGYPYLRARRGHPLHAYGSVRATACMHVLVVCPGYVVRPQASEGNINAFNSLAYHPQSPQ